MRFESITAHDFGPFHEQSLLDLAPGMNVIYGPNEAGKSSWHAALYAGLCGIRRARGIRSEDKDFAERHKPWDNPNWEVGAVITLSDRRRIELRHDLAGKVDSSARDADLAGREYSSEVMNDGAPDGSRWLGLNRRSFLSVACIRQADILSVLADSDSLQEDMQRAAATAGTDATAAAALDRLKAFRADRVGSSRAPTKPLRTSESQEAEAGIALEKARRERSAYLNRRANVEVMEHTWRNAQRNADATRAALAEDDARNAELRLRKSRKLDGLFPDGPPHPSPEQDNLVQQVTTALTLWSDRPSLTELTGPTAEEFEQMVADSERRLIAARAVVAETEARAAEVRFARVNKLQALFTNGTPRSSVEEDNLAQRVAAALESWNLRPALEEVEGPSVEDLERNLAEFDAKPDSPTTATAKPRRLLPLLAAACLAIVGGVTSAVALPDFFLIGAAIVVTGVMGGLAWWTMTRPRGHGGDVHGQAVREMRNSLQERLDLRRLAQRRYEDDLKRLAGVAENLRTTALECGSNVSGSEQQAQALREWQKQRSRDMQERTCMAKQWDAYQRELGNQSHSEIEDKATTLRTIADDLLASADDAYLTEARAQNITNEQLGDLERRLNAKRIKWEKDRGERAAAERQHQGDTERIKGAAGALREAARAANVVTHDTEGDDTDGLATSLQKWQEQRSENLNKAKQQSEEWGSYQQLLAGQSLDEIKDDAARLRSDAIALAKKVDAIALAAASSQQPTQATLNELHHEAENARAAYSNEHGQLEELAKNLPSVADAEDSLADATWKLNYVRQLDNTLGKTIEFLENAQDRVHRNIAPVLRATVLEWLAQVTNQRYTDCRIDPESLNVDVLGPDGRWRNAALLSQGTAEQVYLLLRLALSRHLTKPGETCPLILDDAVAACDAERKQVVLETLLTISEATQVMLFTHEDDVCAWARERLTPPHGLLIELDHPDTSTGPRS